MSDDEGLLDDHEIDHKPIIQSAAVQYKTIQPSIYSANQYNLTAAWAQLNNQQQQQPLNIQQQQVPQTRYSITTPEPHNESTQENDSSILNHIRTTKLLVTPRNTGSNNKSIHNTIINNNNQFTSPKPVLVKSNSIPVQPNHILRTPTNNCTPRRATLNITPQSYNQKNSILHKRTGSTATQHQLPHNKLVITPLQNHSIQSRHKLQHTPIQSMIRPATAITHSNQNVNKSDAHATQMLEFEMMSLENEWTNLKQSSIKLDSIRPHTAMSRYTATVQC